jgi:hypothetical protein
MGWIHVVQDRLLVGACEYGNQSLASVKGELLH